MRGAVRASPTHLSNLFRAPNKVARPVPTDCLNPSAERDAILSAAVEQERDAEHFEEPHPALSRISLVVTRRSFRRGTDHAASSPSNGLDEGLLWDAPPGYSLMSQAKAAPVAVPQVSSRWPTWRARMLFAATVAGVVGLLALEWSAVG